MEYAKKLGRDGYSQYLFDLASNLSSIMPDMRTIFIELLKFQPLQFAAERTCNNIDSPKL